jgi:drug/metabolite transporter (DMT)-like permease
MFSIGIITGLVAMLCWGIGDFFQSKYTKKIGAIKSMFTFNAIGLIFIIPFVIYGYLNNLFIFTQSSITLVIVSSLIYVAGSFFFLRCFEIGDLAVVSPITSAYSIITTALAAVLLSEILPWHKYLAIVLSIIGIFFISGNIRKLHEFHTSKGVKEALITLIFYGLYFYMLALIINDIGFYSTFVFTWIASGVFTIIFSIFMKGKTTLTELKDNKVLSMFIINNILFCFAWIIFNYALVSEKVSILTSISSLYPAVTVMLAVYINKEKLTTPQILGIVLTLLGIFILGMEQAFVNSILSFF